MTEINLCACTEDQIAKEFHCLKEKNRTTKHPTLLLAIKGLTGSHTYMQIVLLTYQTNNGPHSNAHHHQQTLHTHPGFVF